MNVRSSNCICNLSYFDVNRIFSENMKCSDIKRNTYGEGNFRKITDIEARKHREQMGLDTPVVYAVNNEY